MFDFIELETEKIEMTLSKIKTEEKRNKILASIAVALISFSLGFGLCTFKAIGDINSIKEEHKQELQKANKEIENKYRKEIEKLQEELSIKINSQSDIRLIRDDLIESIKEVVESRNFKIQDIDVLRALKSTENRLMDEYIRIASLVLATMETESGFRYIVCENNNGTKDYGIMQVNDVVLPHVKDALGDWIDPINNRDHNVEAGSYEIYECYLKAKDKHPEDVIWWTYAYYNRGMYFESKDTWKNPKNPHYKAVHEQANTRSEIFKEKYNAYYDILSSVNQ